MIWATHAVIAVLASTLTGMTDMQSLQLIALGSLLPDVDRKGTKIARLLPFLSGLFQGNKHHRKHTHSLLFTALLATIHPCLGIGALSHVLADTLNPGGVTLFWPIKKRFALLDGPIKTMTKKEFILLGAAYALTAALFLTNTWGPEQSIGPRILNYFRGLL